MPEIVILVCDRPECPTPKRGAKLFTIIVNSLATEVILCRDHAAPVRDVINEGRLRQQRDDTPARPRGGMSEDSLLSLHVD